MTTFSSAGGGFLGGICLSAYNIVACYSDEIRYGQVIFYGLDTYSLLGSVMNSYYNNGVGRVIALTFDNDSNMLNYIDTYGNNQNVIFGTLRSTDNSIMIEEIQAGLTSAPIDQVLEYNTNTFYVHNGSRVWKFNYNIHTRPLQRLLVNESSLFAQIDTIDGLSHFVSDYNNNIFIYKDFKVTFSAHFDDEIIDMRQITQSFTSIVLIVFDSYILAYKNLTYFSQNNFSYRIDNIYLNKFILIQLDRVILTTHQNTLIDYDFVSNQPYQSIQLEPLDCITASISIKNSQQWLFIYGTITGKIGIYDLNTKIHQLFDAFLSQTMIPVFILRQINEVSLSGPSEILVIHKSGKVISVSISTSYLGLSLSNSQQFATTVERGLATLQEIQIFEVDKANNRYFVNFKGQKCMYVWDLTTHSFIQYLSFPDDEWKRFDMNDSFIILSAAFQLNIYDASKNMLFVTRVRRYNRKDRVTDIRMIDGNKLIAVFTNRIEAILIQPLLNAVVVMDAVSLVDTRLIYTQQIISDNILIFIGIGKAQVIEKRISIGLYQQSNISQDSSNCVSSISYENNASAQNQFESVYSSSTSTKIQYLISVRLSQEIKSMQFLSKSNMSIILRPFSISDQIINIRRDSFANLPFNLQISDFTFSFLEQGQSISFNPNSANITIQNIVISNCEIKSGTSLHFNNQQVVTIQNMKISKVTFVNSPISRLLTLDSSINAKSQFYNNAFLQFSACGYVLLDSIVISDSSFTLDSNMIFASSIGSQQIIIKSLLIVRSSLNGLLKFTQDKSVKIILLTITDCYGPSLSSTLTVPSIHILNFVGINSVIVQSLIAKNNKDVLLLKTNKQYEVDEGIIFLKKDTFTMSDILINNNVLTSFSKNVQINLFSLSSSYIEISNLTYTNNQANIYIYSAIQVFITQSFFELNKGVIGACIQAQDITDHFQIISSKFLQNKAEASGGALYLLQVYLPNIDEQTLISKNTAQIGGGIRILSRTDPIIDMSQITCKMVDNSANIFGKDLATSLNVFKIFQTTLDKQLNKVHLLVYEGQISDLSSSQILLINNVQSGGPLLLFIQLLDQNQQIFHFEYNKFLKSDYSTLIIQELETYRIELTQVILTFLYLYYNQSRDIFAYFNIFINYTDLYLNQNIF